MTCMNLPMQSCNPNAMYVAMYSLSLSGWLEAPYFLAGLGLYSGGMNLRMRVDQNPRLRNLESVCWVWSLHSGRTCGRQFNLECGLRMRTPDCGSGVWSRSKMRRNADCDCGLRTAGGVSE